MSSKPKSSEFKASEQEKALASVSLAEKNYFREKYLPKLTELRDKSMIEEITINNSKINVVLDNYVVGIIN